MGIRQILAAAGVAAYVLVALGCSTSRVLESGAIDLERRDGEKVLAPLLMQYKFELAKSDHQIFFVDQDKHPFNIQIGHGNTTQKGVVLYLPADRTYTLTGILVYSKIGRTLFSFTNPDMFSVKAGVVNVLPYFEVVQSRSGTFAIKQAPSARLDEARAKFKNLNAVNEIKVQLSEDRRTSPISK
jgi:hypothetical protein